MADKKLLLIILLIFIAKGLQAQYNETIRSGRPGQSIGPFTVGKNIFQIQSGLDYATSRYNSEVKYSFVSNNVLRMGLTEHFELSTLFNYQYDQYSFNEVHQNGLSSLQIGFRYNIIDQPKGWIPAIGFQTRFRLPVNSPAYSIAYPAPVMVLITANKLGKGFGLTTNWIASYNGNTPDPALRYVLNLSFPIANKWSGFIENYGSLNDKKSYFDGGIAYLANNNFQLDLLGGIAKNQGRVEEFVSAGVSWRIKFK